MGFPCGVTEVCMKLSAILMIALIFLTIISGCSSSDSITNETVSVDQTDESTTKTEVETDQAPTGQSESDISGITVSFDYKHMSTMASNQFAVWVEDSDGKAVKTITATDFTAARRGYLDRSDTLSSWVKSAEPDKMSDSEIDAISGATPNSGRLEYQWDLTDNTGKRIESGVYTVKLEATLYWSSNVLYSAQIDLSQPISGELETTENRSEPDNTENQDMIANVKMSVY